MLGSRNLKFFAAVIGLFSAVVFVWAQSDLQPAGAYFIQAELPAKVRGLPQQFDAFAIFTRDGTVFSVDQTDGLIVHGLREGKGVETAGVGAWTLDGIDAVEATLFSFVADGQGHRSLGVLRMRARGTPDANGAISGKATFDFFSRGNNPLTGKPDVAIGEGEFTAHRINVARPVE